MNLVFIGAHRQGEATDSVQRLMATSSAAAEFIERLEVASVMGLTGVL